MGFWNLQNKKQNIYHASVNSPRARVTPLVQLKNEHNTTLIIGQHDSCSRLPLSPYNTSTLTLQSQTNNKKKLLNNLPAESPPSSSPPPSVFPPPSSAIYYKRRENKIYYHCVTYATININMQNQQNSTTHYSLPSLLITISLFFSFVHNYNNKLLQQIMHDIMSYLS